MKPITELTDREAEKRLTELIGGCTHCDGWIDYEDEAGAIREICSRCHIQREYYNQWEPYATSYDELIPILQQLDGAVDFDIYESPRDVLDNILEFYDRESK